jgi:hypothetical protein
MPKELKLIGLIALVSYALIWLNWQGKLPGTNG